jgi:multiple sugar transport system substrate-binding protein
LFGFGGKWIDDSGQFLINSPQSVQALTFIKSLYDQKLIEQDVTANRGTQENRFMAGQTAIMPDGNFLVNTLKTQAPTLKYQIGPLPHAAGVAPFAVGVCDYFIAFNTKDAAQSAAATDLANFIYQPANYVPWLVNDGFLPVTSSAVEAYALMVTTVQSVLLGKVGVKAGLDAAEKQIDALPKG